MTSLRWRLARLIAPRPVMLDPFPGRDGVFVVIRQRGFTATLPATRFRLKSARRLEQWDSGTDLYIPFTTFTQFVGTVES
jgi:hypothetical protein